MSRKLRYSSSSYNNLLQDNDRHRFAQKKALRLYKSNAIYTFIPKNACSTMRLSLAFYNGCIDRIEDVTWIHRNNSTFQANLASLCSADYTFVILRCPFSRLASVYLDKIVGLKLTHKLYRNRQKRNLLKLINKFLFDRIRFDLRSMSFYNFVRILNDNALRFDPHWRPQVDFLVYKDYDDYFCAEEFSIVVKTLKSKLDLDIRDARKLTLHGTDHLKKIEDKNFSTLPASTIRQMKENGEYPSYKSLYNDESIELVKTMYSQDIDIYNSIFGNSNLLFP